MQEHALNGILHLFAILAVQAGKTGEDASNLVHTYLTRMLSIQNPEVYLGLFEDLHDLYTHSDNPEAHRRGMDAVCSRLAPVLSPEDRQFFLLQTLYPRRSLGTDGPAPAGRRAVNDKTDETIPTVRSRILTFRFPPHRHCGHGRNISPSPQFTRFEPVCHRLPSNLSAG